MAIGSSPISPIRNIIKTGLSNGSLAGQCFVDSLFSIIKVLGNKLSFPYKNPQIRGAEIRLKKNKLTQTLPPYAEGVDV